MNKVIGWIGVGSMGSRMAANLSKGGYPLIIADKINTEYSLIFSDENPILLNPTELIPTYDKGSLADFTNGGTSFLTKDPPVTNA